MDEPWFVYDPGTEDYVFFATEELALDYFHSCLDYWQVCGSLPAVKNPDIKLMRVHWVIEDGKVKEIL